MASPQPQQTTTTPPRHAASEDPATLALEEGTVLAEISLNEPAGAAASMPGHDSSASSSKLGPYAFPFSMAASCAFEKRGPHDKDKGAGMLPKALDHRSLPAPAGAASFAAAAAVESAAPAPAPMPSASVVSMASMADAETKEEAVEAGTATTHQQPMEMQMGVGVCGVECGGDVRQAVRASLALGRFTRVPECLAAAAGASVLLSLGCMAAESTGFFLAYNGLELGKDIAASAGSIGAGGLNLVSINIGWDRFSLDMNGAVSITTRFLDDVSPGAYALGILSFLLHLLSALTSAAACLWLYHVFIGGGRRRHHTAPAYAPAHARCLPLALALALLGGLLLVASVIGLPVVVRRDFTKAFAPHLDGGFTVRSSWAYGLTLLVCLAACAMAAVLGRRAAHIDRIMAAAAAAAPK